MIKLLSYKDKYIKHLEKSGYSDLTIKTYKIVLSELDIYAKVEKKHDDYLFLDLMDYRIYLSKEIKNSNHSRIIDIREKEKKRKNTTSKKLSVVRSYIGYLSKYQKIKINILNGRSPRLSKNLPKPVSERNITSAMLLANSETKLILNMLYTLGLRVSELSSLELSNIDKNWIRVTGKGDIERDVPLLQSTSEMITRYLSGSIKKRYLFEKDYGVNYSQAMIRNRVYKIFKTCGLHVSPHQLRHSYATDLLNGGAKILEVSELLGHKDLSTTQIYTKISKELKYKEYVKSHPIFKSNL